MSVAMADVRFLSSLLIDEIQVGTQPVVDFKSNHISQLIKQRMLSSLLKLNVLSVFLLYFLKFRSQLVKSLVPQVLLILELNHHLLVLSVKNCVYLSQRIFLLTSLLPQIRLHKMHFFLKFLLLLTYLVNLVFILHF